MALMNKGALIAKADRTGTPEKSKDSDSSPVTTGNVSDACLRPECRYYDLARQVLLISASEANFSNAYLSQVVNDRINTFCAR